MVAQVQNSPIIDLTDLYKFGLIPSLISVTRLAISEGSCRDSGNKMDIIVGGENVEGFAVDAPLFIDLTHQGAGGVDVLPLTANSLYALYVIADSTYKNPTAALASLQSVQNGEFPVMPRGYDTLRLIGYWAVDNSSQLISGYYSGKSNEMTFTYDGVYQVLNNGNATSYTNVVLNAFVPRVDHLDVTFLSVVTINATTDIVNLKGPFFNAAQLYLSPSSTASNSYQQDTVLTQFLTGIGQVIQYQCTSALDTLSLYVSRYQISV